MKRIFIYVFITVIAITTFGQKPGIYRIKNVWTSRYLNIEKGYLSCTEVLPGWQSAMWSLEPVEGTSLFRLKNYWTGMFLNTETSLQCGLVLPGWQSAMWTLQNAGQAKEIRLQNYWRKSYLNIETGNVNCSDIQDGWLSAKWILEPLNASTTPSTETSSPKAPTQIKATGPYQGPAGFDRGMATTMYCGNSPESWVRGNATLDQASGILTITIQLETDATNAGPKGKVTAVLKDCNGNAVANVTTDEIGTGGKTPGSAVIRNFTSQTKIDPKLAGKVCSMYLTSQCTGSIDRLWNVSMDTVNDAFEIIVTVAAAF